MTTKTMLIALALAAAAFATTTPLNGSAAAGGLKALGPALTAPPLSHPLTDKQPGLGVASPVRKKLCTKYLFFALCN